MGWGKQMRSAFGASFLWLVILIYFTQGFRSFVWTAVSYQMKDMLKLSPSASQFVVSVAYFPWSIKPFYGILSDCFPIRQKKRKPYLIIATILSLFPWLVLGLKTSLRSARNPLTFFLTLQNLGAAMADVVIDAMIAEAVRAEKIFWRSPVLIMVYHGSGRNIWELVRRLHIIQFKNRYNFPSFLYTSDYPACVVCFNRGSPLRNS